MKTCSPYPVTLALFSLWQCQSKTRTREEGNANSHCYHTVWWNCNWL